VRIATAGGATRKKPSHLVKIVPQVSLRDGLEALALGKSAHVQRRDEGIFRLFQLGHVAGFFHELFGDGVVGAVVTVADVLLGQGILGIHGTLVSAGRKD